MKMSGQGQIFCMLLIYLKHSKKLKIFFTKL